MPELLSMNRPPKGGSRLRWLAWVSGIGLLFHDPAHAAEAGVQEPVELAWVRLEGAESCPPRAAFITALEKRVRSSEFVAKAQRVLTVTLSNEKGPYRAVLSLKSKTSSEVESKQELFSYSTSCDEVFAATVLSVALLLNPDEFGKASDASSIEEDNGFFDPPEDQPLGVPSQPSKTRTKPSGVKASYEIPVAPPPWARSRVFVGGAVVAALEQLPQVGPGFAARVELPLQPTWLLWLEGNWLKAQPLRSTGSGAGVHAAQDAAWVGVNWLPYYAGAFEFHLGGGAGFRRLQFTLTDDEPRLHFAAQLGIGTVFYLLPFVGLQAQATAVVPVAQESVEHRSFGSTVTWTQPPVGGQLHLGVMFGIPGAGD